MRKLGYQPGEFSQAFEKILCYRSAGFYLDRKNIRPNFDNQVNLMPFAVTIKTYVAALPAEVPRYKYKPYFYETHEKWLIMLVVDRLGIVFLYIIKTQTIDSIKKKW